MPPDVHNIQLFIFKLKTIILLIKCIDILAALCHSIAAYMSISDIFPMYENCPYGHHSDAGIVVIISILH